MHSLLETTAERTNNALIEPGLAGSTYRLDALGQLLYGEHWGSPMARDLNIPLGTITNWTSGKRELLPDHPIFVALAVLVYHHDKGVARARKIMDRGAA
jgi:hypothetical protein